MGTRTSIDLPAVIQHRERLPRVLSAMSQDIEAARARVRSTVRAATQMVEHAQDLLDSLYEECRDEDNDRSERDIDDALDHVRSCENYYEDVCERASRAEARIARIESEYKRHHNVACREFDALISSYRAFDAVSIGNSRGSHTELDVDSPSGTEHHDQFLTVGGGPDLPLLPGGLLWVPLTNLDWDEIPETLAFEKARRDQIEGMMQRFASKIVPLLMDPRSVTREELIQLDRVLGVGGEISETLEFAWDCLIGGNDVIVVNRPHPLTGALYRFTSGRHRAVVARGLGWTHIPARVM